MDIRLQIEQREKVMLSPWAICAANSQGRERLEKPDPIRTAFMLDRDRIIHSKSFRRLKHKTQVFIAPPGDHYRTRLTHTLEVNQIGKTIAAGLNLNLDLIEAIALAHDVGHTPFAHSGEIALNHLLPDGFQHNRNSIRVLTRIEQHKDKPGLNLTAEVLDGVLHHSGYGENKPPAATLEGQTIRLSDKIAYVQHDIDDSIRAGLLSPQDLPTEYIKVLGTTHSERIATLVSDAIYYTNTLMAAADNKPTVSLSPPIDQALRGLRNFMFKNIYQGDICKAERRRATFIIEKVFEFFMQNPQKMSPLFLQIAEEEGLARAVGDYISGMTDDYCTSIFEAIYVPRSLLPDVTKIDFFL